MTNLSRPIASHQHAKLLNLAEEIFVFIRRDHDRLGYPPTPQQQDRSRYASVPWAFTK